MSSSCWSLSLRLLKTSTCREACTPQCARDNVVRDTLCSLAICVYTSFSPGFIALTSTSASLNPGMVFSCHASKYSVNIARRASGDSGSSVHGHGNYQQSEVRSANS